LLFIGARQPHQLERQSYADHIEGLHYLETSFILFPLKGRVKESISLAKESSGEQKGGVESVCMRGYTGEKRHITPEQQHLYATAEKACVLQHMCTCVWCVCAGDKYTL